jgi:uncharacterized membrane protein
MKRAMMGRRGGRWLVLAGALLAGCGPGGDATGPGGAARVEISAPSTFVEMGQKLRLSAVAKDASGRTMPGVPVSWSSSAPAVAEVAEGMVTGRTPGHAYIRASAGAAADSIRITVEGPPVGEIVVWPDTLHLIRGRAGRLFVEVYDRAGKTMANPVVFSASAPDVASVNGSGEVQGVALGSTSVTVSAGLKSVQVPVHVVTGDRYSVRHLGSLRADESFAVGINNRGEVVGHDRFIPLGNTSFRPFVWRKGALTELGGFNIPVAINDSSTVIGTADNGSSWIWRAGALTGFRTDTAVTLVAGINNRGDLVGTAFSGYCYGCVRGTAPHSAFIRVDGQTSWLPWHAAPAPEGPAISAAGQVTTRAINDRRVAAVHTNHPPSMLGRAYTWENGQYTPIPRPEGSATGWWAADINNQGQVLGSYVKTETYQFNAEVYWYLWDGTRVTDLGKAGAGAWASAMNRYADGVGGWLLLRGGEMMDLNAMLTTGDWNIIDARDINDLGQIAAVGVNKATGRRRALLLTPAQ